MGPRRGQAPRRPTIAGVTPAVQRYSIHGVEVAVSFDRPELAAALDARLRAFRREATEAPPDLSFEYAVVPGAASHVFEEPPAAARRVYEPQVGEVLYDEPADRLLIDYEGRVRLVVEPALGRVRGTILEAEAGSLWLLTHPMFTLPLMELMKRRGRYVVHAACVAVDGRGLLLPGTSGSGKSTLSIALARAGFGFLGDDIVFLASEAAGLSVLAFPDEIDVTDQTAGFFPELRPLLERPPTPGWHKRQVWPERLWGAEIVGRCRPVALVFPRVAGRSDSVLAPMDPGEALLEVATNVLLTEPAATRAHLDAVGDLVRHASCYRLETGRDLDRVPALLRGLLD